MSERYELHHGDCLDILRTLPDNSIDAVVTDPPYGLSFMGKKWDYDVPSEDIWRECLRVLKPGGHLLAFAGTRTQHRMAVRIEDAGFEIRDMIAWVYGSGFPKSLDVGKAIDKNNGEIGRKFKFTRWMCTTGVTAKQINQVTNTQMGNHYLTHPTQPAIPTPELWQVIRPLCGDVPAWVDDLVARIAAEREVVGQKVVNGEEGTAGGYQNGIASVRGSDVTTKREIDITAPATDAAKQWHGWGTALKPALEPITVARKPLDGTVADNVLEWGTGALNIDSSRIPTDASVDDPRLGGVGTWSSDKMAQNVYEGGYAGERVGSSPLGRWPANLIHDGSEEVVGLFPMTKSGKMGPQHTRTTDGSPNGIYGKFDANHPLSETYGDSGSAARFFYCAKASKADRGEGNITPPTGRWPANLIHDGSEEVMGLFPESKSGIAVRRNSGGCTFGSDTPKPQMDDIGYGDSGSAARFFYCAKASKRDRDEGTERNGHPTVKPTALMRYLCRLVTPPGGVVLDPFMGSGSTGKGAILEGFRFVGIEREAEYIDIARARIQHAVDSLPNTLFDNTGE